MTQRIFGLAFIGAFLFMAGCTGESPVEPITVAESVQDLPHDFNFDATLIEDFSSDWVAGKVPSETFIWLVGQPFLPGPCATKAANGETIEVNGAGFYGTHPKSVGPTVVGTYTRKDAGGNVVASGTYTATQMISFVSYGEVPCATVPSQCLGGQLILRIELDTGDEALLKVQCLIGNPPGGAAEGMRLNLSPGGPNFNKELGGCGTVYIRCPLPGFC